jgi:two-component system sensor histidine kinase PilS (NtrC family)
MGGSIELLRGTASLGDEDRRLMDIVLREAARLDQLVTRFLEYSRPSAPRRADADLSRLVGETLEVFSHDPAASKVRLEPVLQATPAWCDPDQLRQVLWNLLVNAAQAAAGRDGARGATIRVRCAPEIGGGALLEVQDNGPGIAPEDLAQIFTPFFTTKARGSGLGLATVQRVVDAHGGTVAASSQPGAGACFTVRLPPRPEADADRAAG